MRTKKGRHAKQWPPFLAGRHGMNAAIRDDRWRTVSAEMRGWGSLTDTIYSRMGRNEAGSGNSPFSPFRGSECAWRTENGETRELCPVTFCSKNGGGRRMTEDANQRTGILTRIVH